MQASGILQPGTLVDGTYQIIDFIGQGAMGAVYKVQHIHLQKIMALKILRAEILNQAVWLRFQLEAKAIARLDNANIIQIYDMSQTEDGLPYYSMEFLEGISLADLIAQNSRLSTEVALPIFRQICNGLSYAHDHSIIHRDIKPGNIVLIKSKSEGAYTAKVVDFGIAKMVDFSNQPAQGLTMPGEIFGTPLYMSPEQCIGAKLDQRTDIYSLGVTLFQTLTGRPPLLGKTAVDTMMMHQTQHPLSLNDAVQEDIFAESLELVVAKMLEKSVDRRYRSMAEVARDLLAVETAENYEAPPIVAASIDKQRAKKTFSDLTAFDMTTIEPKKGNWLIPALAIILLSVGAIGAYTFMNKPEKAVPAPKAVAKIKPTDEPENLEPYATELIARDDQRINGEQQYVEDTTSEILQKRVSDFLASDPRPYKIKEIAGVTTYQFPADFSIGTLELGREIQPAQGTVTFKTTPFTIFRAANITAANPQLLGLFREHDFNCVNVDGHKRYNKDLIKYLSPFKYAAVIELPNCELINEDIKFFETMPNLVLLGIDHAKIDGKVLAQSPLMLKVQQLRPQQLKNLSAVLQALTRNEKLDELNLTKTKMTQQDYDNIGKMKHLKRLYVKACDMTDENLAALKALDLTNLSILQNPKLTEKSFKTIKHFNHLTEFKTDLSFTPEQQ